MSENFKVGDTVAVPDGMHGIIKYIGEVPPHSGIYAGICLDSKYTGKGRNSGNVKSKIYFDCPANSGIFVAITKLKVLNSTKHATSQSPSPSPLRSRPLRPVNDPVSRTPRKLSSSTSSATAVRSIASAKSSTGSPAAPRSAPSANAARRSSALHSSPLKQSRPPSSDQTQLLKELDMLKKSLEDHKAIEVSLHATISDQESTIAELTRDLKSQSSALDDAQKALELSLSSCQQQTDLNADLQAQIRDISAQLASLESSENPETQSLEETVLELNRLLEEKDRLIQHQQEEFETHRAGFLETINELKNNAETADMGYLSRIAQLEVQIQDLTVNSSNSHDTSDADAFNDTLHQLQTQLLQTEKSLQDSQFANSTAQDEIRSLKQDLTALRAELDTAKHENSVLESNLHSLSAKVEQTDLMCANLNMQISSLNNELKTKDTTILELKENIISLERMVERDVLSKQDLSNGVSQVAMNGISEESQFQNAHRDNVAWKSPPNTADMEFSAVDNLEVNSLDTFSLQDAASGRPLWCGLCEREGHNALDCPYENNEKYY
ncbi:hypothetical protein CANCADRAFT_45993 [Tortispora caseinolytica NRRL Y-17796]|uniref:CAP-Gly domain-containing protein n=1 Tax=Tortispora caseinolytica NRRL Y-17796 TaxID=767744 RepID=A0A1E4TCU1_9ASCO|nr:hypothetical protein CANCADRAFT_45993 [Tortispora caseinolytica NRRL Y-17796]